MFAPSPLDVSYDGVKRDVENNIENGVELATAKKQVESTRPVFQSSQSSEFIFR